MEGKSRVPLERSAEQRCIGELEAEGSQGGLGASADDICGEVRPGAGWSAVRHRGRSGGCASCWLHRERTRRICPSHSQAGQGGIPRLGDIHFTFTNGAAGDHRGRGDACWLARRRRAGQNDADSAADTRELCGVWSGARVQRAHHSGGCTNREGAFGSTAQSSRSEGSVRGAGASGHYLPSSKTEEGAATVAGAAGVIRSLKAQHGLAHRGLR